MKMLSTLLSSVLLLLSLSACSSQSADPADAPITFPNTYVSEINPSDDDGNEIGNVFIRLEIPAEPPADLADVGTDGITYVQATIDNRDSDNPISVESVSLSDKEETFYSYLPVEQIVGTVEAGVPDEYTNAKVEPGEIGTIWIASTDGLPEEATDIDLVPSFTESIGFYISALVPLDSVQNAEDYQFTAPTEK